MNAPMRVVRLHSDTAAMLRRPINGRGGFQSLMRRIQLGLRGRQLRVGQADLDALVRALKQPHVGGFQRRARAILVDVIMQDLRPAPPPPPARVLRFDRGQRHLPFEDELS